MAKKIKVKLRGLVPFVRRGSMAERNPPKQKPGFYSLDNNSVVLRRRIMKFLGMFLASLGIFFATYFALAENKNSSTLFLDSDQDGLTDQEEKMLGTDPRSADTDGDGYSDGKETASGYNPLKPAPGDKLMPGETISASTQNSSANTASGSSQNLLDSLANGNIDEETLNSIADDPGNLTEQVISNFLDTTLNKAQSDSSFSTNPNYSAEDLTQIIQNALTVSDIQKSLPEIHDDEIKALPEISKKKLTDDEVKEKEKEQIEKYLSSLAFVFATNSPFKLDDPANLAASLNSEQSAMLSAINGGDQAKIDAYAKKARAAIDQIKEVDVPFVMKDFHKSALQLAIYTLDFKDKVAVNPKDPLKNLAAIGSLQSASESALKLQDQLSSLLDYYGIDAIDIGE